MSAADKARQLPQEEGKKPEPELSAAPASEVRPPEPSETFELVKSVIDDAVANATRREGEIEAASATVTDIADEHRGKLTPAEKSELDAIVTRAQARLDELKERAAEVVSGEPATIAEAEPKPPSLPAGAAEESEADSLWQGYGPGTVAAETKAPEAEAPDVTFEEPKVAPPLAEAVSSPVAKAPEVPSEPLDLSEEVTPTVLEPDEEVTPTEPLEPAAEVKPLYSEPDEEEATPISPPDFSEKTEPPAPEGAAEAEPARTRTARGLVNIAKIRRVMRDEDPIWQEQAIEQAKYAELRGIMENEELTGRIEQVVRAMSKPEQDAKVEGDAALGAIAAEVGVPVEELRDIVMRQRVAIEDRARREVQQESQASIGKVALKGVAYIGLAAVLQKIGGVGFLTAPVRMVEAWRQGVAQEQKVQKRVVAFTAQLAEVDLTPGEAPLAHKVLESITAQIARLKQRKINEETELEPVEAAQQGARASERLATDVDHFLRETHPELSQEQRSLMARAARGLSEMDRVRSTLEAKVAAREPTVFNKIITTMDKVLGSKVLRGGETGQERALTIGVFMAAGMLAREMPGIRNILFAYSGMKAGELAANMIVKRGRRFEALQPVTAAELKEGIVPESVLRRAHVQLLDEKFREKDPAEYQRISEAVDRCEANVAARTESAVKYVDGLTEFVEDSVSAKMVAELDKKRIVNAMRLAGAGLGVVLGDIAVRWVAERFPPPEEAAAPVAAAPAREVAVPVTEASTMPVEAVAVAPTSEAAPSEVMGAGIAPLETPLETDPRILELAMIRKGDGFTQVISRQLEYRPEQFGFTGDSNDTEAVHQWAVGEAKRIAIEQGFLGADERTTELGLRAGSGGFLLQPDGDIELVEPEPGTYRVGQPLGLEPTALQVAVEKQAQTLALATERDISALSNIASGKPDTTQRGFISRLLREAEERLASERRLIQHAAWESDEGARHLKEGIADQARVIREFRDKFSALGITSQYSSSDIPSEAISSGITPEPGGVAAGVGEGAAETGAAETSVAGAGEIARTPGSTWENLLRGDRPTGDRLAQIKDYLQRREIKFKGGQTIFKLDDKDTPIYSTDSGATFQPLDESSVQKLVDSQKESDDSMAGFRPARS